MFAKLRIFSKFTVQRVKDNAFTTSKEKITSSCVFHQIRQIINQTVWCNLHVSLSLIHLIVFLLLWVRPWKSKSSLKDYLGQGMPLRQTHAIEADTCHWGRPGRHTREAGRHCRQLSVMMQFRLTTSHHGNRSHDLERRESTRDTPRQVATIGQSSVWSAINMSLTVLY